jgi:rSAM/selenodomain-associated transferase 1
MPEVLCQRKDVLIIQFAKLPIPGQVKTRMLGSLSPVEASELHSELMLWTCRTLTGSDMADVELWVSGGSEHVSIRSCQNLGVTAVHSQHGSDLGERMFHAISDGLLRYRKLVLVGSDCPAIDQRYLTDALTALDTESLVLGPANDGGYVLIGATHIDASLFQGVSWGSGVVLQETRERLVAAGRSWSELSTLSDIDRPEDLPLWEAIKNREEGAVGRA